MRILKKIRRLWKNLVGDRWVVRRYCWPYEEGYATYNKWRRIILDTGLSKEAAQDVCDEMNFDL